MSNHDASKSPIRFRRLLLKIGGESLCKPGGSGIDVEATGRTADLIGSVADLGAEIGLVVGGGNLLRGGRLASSDAANPQSNPRGSSISRPTADAMGMLATVMNALALADVLRARGRDARVLSAFAVGGFTELFSAAGADRHLRAGRIVLLAGGTGNPFFTTDTCAALRAAEIGAEVLVKATKVDGVYSDDPMVNPDAVRYKSLTYQEVLERELGVMDLTAITLCRENAIRVAVCNLWQAGAIEAVLGGNTELCTWIGASGDEG